MSSGANKIEITQSTLLKLLVRRGSNEERKNIVLSEGELGYAVDTKKLFIGDGATRGGIPVSSQILYGAVSPTTYTAAVLGDVIYDSTEGVLYLLNGVDPTIFSNWEIVTRDVRVDDETMQLITYNGIPNTLVVKTVSAAQLDLNLPGIGLEYGSISGGPITTIQTTANQSFDSIILRSATALQMPNTLQFGTVGGATQYNIPSFDGINGYSLVTNGNGVLEWKPGNSVVEYRVLSGNQVPVGTIVQFGSGGNFARILSALNVPYGYLLCDGRSLNGSSYTALSNVIGNFYGPGSAPPNTFNIPSLTASNYVYLIKYLEDQYLPNVTVSLGNGLTGLNVTSSASVTSFDIFQNNPTEFRISVPDYVSKTYVDSSNVTKVKRLVTMAEPNCSNGYNSESYTMFIDSQDRVRFAGFNGRGVAGIGNPSFDGSGNYSELNSYIDLPVLWDASSNEYEKVVDVYGAECTTFVLTNSGRIWSAGDNYYGCLGRGVIGTRDNGRYDLVNIPAAAGKVTKISIGGGWWGNQSTNNAKHVFALTDSGSAFGWGNNQFGQLGTGSTADTATPICVNTGVLLNKLIKNIYSFSGYAYGYSFAIDTSNNVYCAGWNGFGALGTGNTVNQTSWKQLTAFTADEIYGAAAGGGSSYQSTFLLSGGKLWGAGYNGAYNLGLNDAVNRTTFVPVCASGSLSTQLTGVSSLSISDITYATTVVYALMQDNTLRAWGRNAEGQCGIGSFTTTVSAPTSNFNTGSNFSNSNITKVRAVGIGPYSGVLALDSTGTLWFTGYNGAAARDSFAGIGTYGVNINAFTRVSTPYGIRYKDFMLFKSSTNKTTFTGYSVLATDTKNNLYGWGNNDASQLGIDEVGSYDANILPDVYMPVKLKI
jgi:alpha-tubulin suppressor-like RCC1 family protein